MLATVLQALYKLLVCEPDLHSFKHVPELRPQRWRCEVLKRTLQLFELLNLVLILGFCVILHLLLSLEREGIEELARNLTSFVDVSSALLGCLVRVELVVLVVDGFRAKGHPILPCGQPRPRAAPSSAMSTGP